jgi:hypothetical protein
LPTVTDRQKARSQRMVLNELPFVIFHRNGATWFSG